MTRCEEFYEKVKKDGNFCGMSDKEYRRLVQYTEEVERDEEGKATINQGAWLKQKREQAKKITPTAPVESNICKSGQCIRKSEVVNEAGCIDVDKIITASAITPTEEVPNEQIFTDLLQTCAEKGVTGTAIMEGFIASMQKFYPNFYLSVEYEESCSCDVGAKK